MRLLFFADLHLDAAFAWAPAEVARRRRAALRQALVNITDLALRLRVDAVCSGGDLYEQDRFTPDTARFLQSTFAALAPVPIFLAPGNHDWFGPTSLYRQVEWSDNVHVFTEATLMPAVLTEGLTLWGAAHRGPANTPNLLDGFRATGAGVHVALFHGSERGDHHAQGSGKQPHAPFRADQIRPAGLHHALVGHFHTPRDAPWHTYPGNPEPLTFGETGPRGAVLVAVAPDGSVTRERHRVAVTEVTDLEVDLTGATHAGEVRDRVAKALAGVTGTVRATLHGELGPDVALDLADLDDVAPHLDPPPLLRVGNVTVGYDLEALAAERTVRGQFVRDVLASGDLDEEQRRRVLVTGLRALDGRTDLAVP
jgi:DNA repair exonuclease SbcCD nuclease subunit